MRAINSSIRLRVAASGMLDRGAGRGDSGVAATCVGVEAGGATGLSTTCCGAGGVTAGVFFFAQPGPTSATATAARTIPRERKSVEITIALFLSSFGKNSYPVETGSWVEPV